MSREKFLSIARALRKADISDMVKLKNLHLIDRIEREHGHKPDRHQETEKRRAFHRAIAERSENGLIAMVWSGRDCDNVRYAGEVRLVKADWRSIEAADDDYNEWADGPCGYYLERPSVATGIHYRSRDLALEAFENGHAHHIIDPGEI